jgi:hypothetical protein
MIERIKAISEGSRENVKAPSCYPAKACHPSALQRIGCTPADYRLQKSVGQTTNGTEQGSTHCLV